MEHRLKKEITDDLVPDTTQETSKSFLGFDVINIKQENDETGAKEPTSKHQSSKINSYSCCICNKTYKGKATLRTHMNFHTRENLFKCTECNKEFTRKCSLILHLEKHTNQRLKKETGTDKPNKCETCNKTFLHNYLLIRHMRIHTGEKPYECSECNRKFRLVSNMQRHKKLHEINTSKHPNVAFVSEETNPEVTRTAIKKIYECKICNKKFAYANYVEHHMRLHVKPYECIKCHRKFTFKNRLYIHMKTHEAETSFGKKVKKLSKCKICNKVVRSCYMEIHLGIHGGVKPYECTECNKKFLCKQRLDRHMKIHGKETSKEYCPICNKEYALKVSLKDHMKTHARKKLKVKQPHKCKICDKIFRCYSLLQKHLIIHTGEKPHKCSECNKQFYFKESLVRHKRIHHFTNGQAAIEKPHQCEHCGKKFIHRNALINHTRAHTGERPFECAKCDKKYTIRSALKVHMQTHITKIKKITKAVGKRSHTSSKQIVRLTPEDTMDEIKVKSKNIKAEKIDLVEPTVSKNNQSEHNEFKKEETAQFSLFDNSSYEAIICKEEVMLPDERF